MKGAVKMKKVLLATKNKGKIMKFGKMLTDLNIEWCTLDDMNINIDIPETGISTEENAKLKAECYYEIANIPVLCDDTALIIDNFPPDKQPGVFVRRYGGKELSDDEIIGIYSKELDKYGGKSDGRFIITLAIIKQYGEYILETFYADRPFVSVPCKERISGFPLRSLMYYEKFNKYMAQMTEQEMEEAEGNVYKQEKEFLSKILK